MADSFNSVTRPSVNIAGTTAPTVSNDQTQGYSVGSLWFDTTNYRVWECLSAATGAAVWAFSGSVPANQGFGVSSSEPGGTQTQFGSGTGVFLEEGNIYRYVSGTGTSPTATGSYYVLAAFTIPANSFDGIGNRGISLEAWGTFANNTNTKEVQIIYNPATAVVGSVVGTGGTVICDTGAYSTTGLAGYFLGANVFKYGAAGSNTQLATSQGVWIGSTHIGGGSGTAAPQLLTATESGNILVAVCGKSTTTAGDVTLNQFFVNVMN